MWVASRRKSGKQSSDIMRSESNDYVQQPIFQIIDIYSFDSTSELKLNF